MTIGLIPQVVEELPKSLLGVGILLALGVAIQMIGWKLREPRLRSSGLLLVLTGFFVALTLSLWRVSEDTPWLGTALIAVAAVIFRLMASFEPPPAGD